MDYNTIIAIGITTIFIVAYICILVFYVIFKGKTWYFIINIMLLFDEPLFFPL